MSDSCCRSAYETVRHLKVVNYQTIEMVYIFSAIFKFKFKLTISRRAKWTRRLKMAVIQFRTRGDERWRKWIGRLHKVCYECATLYTLQNCGANSPCWEKNRLTFSCDVYMTPPLPSFQPDVCWWCSDFHDDDDDDDDDVCYEVGNASEWSKSARSVQRWVHLLLIGQRRIRKMFSIS